MTNSRTLVRQLKAAATRLRKAARWHGSGLAVDAHTDNFVYELLCYFELALATTATFNIAISGQIKVGKHPAARWPKKPGNKSNFSYLLLSPAKLHGEHFQLCPGVNIRDIHGKNRAPDVNLLSGNAPDTPTYAHLLACWDAKLIANSTLRLPDTAVSDFAYTVRQLGMPSPPAIWAKSIVTPAYCCSGLFTNGNRSTEPDSALAASGICETYGFPHKPSTRP